MRNETKRPETMSATYQSTLKTLPKPYLFHDGLAGEFKVQRMRDLPVDAPLTDTPDKAYQFHKAHVQTAPWFDDEKEHLVCLVLNTRRTIRGFYLVATGTMDTILCHPREVFRPAVIMNAAALIVMHNHPSGDPAPSEADIRVTRDLIKAGQLLKIEVLDHVIAGVETTSRSKAWCSLRELGYFYA